MKAKIFVLFFILTCHVFGQSTEIQHSFKLPFEPVTGSIDRQGHLYLASIDGVIEKYDQSGKLLYHFSPQKKATPSLLEAWQGLRVFAYYQAFQEYFSSIDSLQTPRGIILISLSLANSMELSLFQQIIISGSSTATRSH